MSDAPKSAPKSYVEWVESRLQPATQFEFSVPDVSEATNVSDKTITKLIEAGKFYPRARNASAGSKRPRYMIQRAAVIDWVRDSQT